MDNTSPNLTPEITARPPLKHALKAFALAPLVSIIPVFVIIVIMALLDPSSPNALMAGIASYFWGLIISYGHILCIALPFYLGARNKANLTLKNCTVSGALIAGLPLFLIMFLWDTRYAAPTLTPRNPFTLYLPPVIFALCGAATGAMFWRLLSKAQQTN
jgi:hypothetical protein